MVKGADISEPTPGDAQGALLARALCVDLEVTPQGKLLKVGAVFGEKTLAWSQSGRGGSVWEELAELAVQARVVLGHNLVRHDLRVLRATRPDHPLLRLPVIDTLVLSPIAFPENPYHRLVKDYKLVRETVNDPVADARQAVGLFGDETRALEGMRKTEPGLFEWLHFLLATAEGEGDRAAEGMEQVFAALGGTRPTVSRGVELGREFFARWACRSVPLEPPLLATAAQRMAVAYAVTWLRVAGANSVLPPWVRLEYPATREWLHRLRDVPCTAPDCAYCRRTHDAQKQLRAFFGFPEFRPQPAAASGGSLQREIIEAGLRNESLLAILPTGGGKSLCYQLPALVRNQRRGVLTVVISPLQSLMKDQVDGLVRRTGTPYAGALYGLLTPPERGDLLRRVRMGDLALLYVAPEQLRNRSFREAILYREIGCWVIDEAHCLSKWGHDFRPDYLYAGRFMRELAAKQGEPLPSIACFTATAKAAVKAEIQRYFREETGRELTLFEGGVERENLCFEVQSVASHAKLGRVHDLLTDRLRPSSRGSGIVFRATRDDAELTATFLGEHGWQVAHFHAGLNPAEKKRIQDAFLGGELAVICATNAFGMGIDKEDVRLVIHADTPGSIENYLQEAGRAGRDGKRAECVLLYNEEDLERQFRMGARSELGRKDLAQILRGLRKAARGEKGEVVITTGEILRDEEVDTGILLEDRGADTQVRTAISWLERAGFIQRDENVTQVFQARPLVRTLTEAEVRMERLRLPAVEAALWRAILREMMNLAPTESLTVDQLALLPELGPFLRRDPESTNPQWVSAKVLKTLGSMAQAGLLKRDTLLNAFVRHGVTDPSRRRFARVVQADRKLVDLLAVEAPDAEGWMSLSLCLVNQRLGEALGGSDDAEEPGRASRCSTELVRTLLRSLSEDGRGFAGSRGSIDLRLVARDTYRVRVRRSWQAIAELAEKRRRVAAVVLDVLLGRIPAETPARADLLVEFSFEELREAIDRDLELRSDVKDVEAAIERALMYLHEQHVIVLQQGLAVFRAAMRIRLNPAAKGEPYGSSHYQPLAEHYHERVLQVHVMSEYARRGLGAIREALALVLAYFTVGKEEFIRRYLSTKPELLEHATTAQSYARIVTELENRAQIGVVTASPTKNLLILAGPGSGKTRTVVHRCAYLLRVKRVRPASVLVCCFNRQAAIELRRRLRDLAGEDARGVTVLTYHSLALRLLGYSFAGGGPGRRTEIDLDALIPEAVRLLRGERVPPGVEPDEVRDRLLAGFQHILVDEYQDIDEPQYELISAIAGRTLADADRRLSILAVGDDDQNIYTFRGANVEFIRRFQRDYGAEVHYLVENYRATRHVIEASNQLIAANRDRMKTAAPIGIDRARRRQPAGGDWGKRDALSGGRVQVVRVSDQEAQAEAVMAEIVRLKGLGVSDWSRMAVLASTRRDLVLVRARAESAGIPVRWYAERNVMPPLYQVRELHQFLAGLEGGPLPWVRASALLERAGAPDPRGRLGPWWGFLRQLLEAWRIESDDAESPPREVVHFILEACAESRRELTYGEGIVLSTVHSAKGTEHDHVMLMGSWPVAGERPQVEERRRVFYVGMTRARLSLAVFERVDIAPSLPATLTGSSILRRDFDRVTRPSSGTRGQTEVVDYEVLGREEIHLGYAGRFPAGDLVHAALGRLQTGDRLCLVPTKGGGLGLQDEGGVVVARLSHQGSERWKSRWAEVREVRVLAMVHRSAAQDPEAERREGYQVAAWEYPVVELVLAPSLRQLGAQVDDTIGGHGDPRGGRA